MSMTQTYAHMLSPFMVKKKNMLLQSVLGENVLGKLATLFDLVIVFLICFIFIGLRLVCPETWHGQ